MRYVPIVLLLAGCAGPTVLSTPNSCASLVPSAWNAGVAPPPLPNDDTVGAWVEFGDAAVGKLDVANGRYRDAREIQDKCEARDRLAVKEATRGWLARLFH